MLTYSKKDSYIIPVTASFIGLSVKLRLPHTSHLTPHNSGSGQKAALDVDYRMVWAFSGMVTGK
ncbi:hypothetical protein UN89_05000 [Escherichia coli]|nr:hypothetical protein UN88_22995 [Escherichia coli]KJW42884.1 hypothetical protein UN89_05000 [Escherichia coli]KJY12720.1 hypothetical protein UC21_04815 [Escherichia coli]